MSDIYDCIIVGAGPAGLAGALYASRDDLKTLVLDKFYPGGQISNTDRIENYPGIERIDGPALVEQMKYQAENFGTVIKANTRINSIEKLEDGNIQVNARKDRFTARAVILAPGSDYRKLGIPGEEQFRSAGAGVSYCGTCDAPFFKGKEVISIGGGNTAVEETLHLCKYASKVTLVHRRDEFRADAVLVRELKEKASEAGSNLTIIYDSAAVSINGEKSVESVTLKNVKTQDTQDISCDGVFVFIGMVPNTDFLKDTVKLSPDGFIECDPLYLRTDIPGIFAAGDCRRGAAMQLATATADGVVTAMALKYYFRDLSWWDKKGRSESLGW